MNAANMSLSKQALDFAPSILAIQGRPASPLPRVMLYTLLILFVLIVLWAIFGKVDVVAVAQGKLVPQSYLKIVQPAEAGIVKEILVKEGDTVAQGQVLMRMDAKLQESDTKMVEADLKQRQLQIRRIDAELSGKPLLMKARTIQMNSGRFNRSINRIARPLTMPWRRNRTNLTKP